MICNSSASSDKSPLTHHGEGAGLDDRLNESSNYAGRRPFYDDQQLIVAPVIKLQPWKSLGYQGLNLRFWFVFNSRLVLFHCFLFVSIHASIV
jgi:hypothetical protein